ncbi:YbfB/YjiJ family MFS transporter [Pandoraea nosoerga]|uniref:MFS transporter n=1 Tax=Pandoraea nosoerga TaxID=2508296 RepID=A0A5E4X0W3_9BURK|nr:YbfB/YjiJ family MFS transporter [Pandoraea nosoerga]MBN4667035.1 YbfB/YjiJ family MFS transporter [Pandoraea nosoerga]MBN4676407.1 YbfB/YjiJ family MFS transporter [Pandoraea nosoerga]MBN4681445.1 YbfB/YjiJ family MFS transporter [Pandoraea nosoerga]MBN4746142.1 YbfB/YjiJ family MFS transporter [Pandoraea nosoerga]VVE29903.1 MFS transporter [Pandoraea nosoerga]
MPATLAESDSAVTPRQPRPERAAWRIALSCMLALSIAMGIGRFAFTPMLPLMLHEHLTDIQHGSWLASLNYAGYFVGALSCMWLHLTPTLIIRFALATTVALTFAMGMTESFVVWAVVRTLAGVMSAWAMVFSAGWGFRKLAELRMPSLGGVIFAGPGAGIVVTGLLASLNTAMAWPARGGWLSCGVLALVLLAAIWRTFVADAPAASAAPGASRTADDAAPHAVNHGSGENVIPVTVLYGFAGFGYIITATFLPVIARQALPGSPWPDLFFPLLGLMVIPGAIIGARAPLAWDNRLLLAACYVMQGAGVGIGIVLPNVAGFALGSVLVGLPFTAITVYAVRECRRLRGDNANGLIGLVTASYGIGQIVGPLVAAPLVAATGSFTAALLCASGVLALGAIGFVWDWRRSHEHAP